MFLETPPSKTESRSFVRRHAIIPGGLEFRGNDALLYYSSVTRIRGFLTSESKSWKEQPHHSRAFPEQATVRLGSGYSMYCTCKTTSIGIGKVPPLRCGTSICKQVNQNPAPQATRSTPSSSDGSAGRALRILHSRLRQPRVKRPKVDPVHFLAHVPSVLP
ncbi:hypothetical protein BD777DRAFT_136591 [Yarrowia lipolytica]|nr:hypothetical protein BD777DRAFT_136591 [Yarrowia lipolytica]